MHAHNLLLLHSFGVIFREGAQIFRSVYDFNPFIHIRFPMQLLYLLRTADSDSVGRFNTDSLPQKALIELLVENLAEVSIAKDAEDKFIDIEKWSIFTFDAAGSITHIQMMGRSLRDLFRATQMGRNIPRTIERNSFDKGGEIDLQYCNNRY